jgi:HAE1 family hydrophobic/amphiphilic exporter-1
VLLLAAVIMVMTGLMAYLTPMEYMPKMVGGFYQTMFKLPPGSRLEESLTLIERVQKDMTTLHDYKRLFMIVGETGDPMRAAFRGGEMGTNEGEIMLMMKKEADGRTTSDQTLREMWDEIANDFPNAEVNFKPVASFEMETGKPIQIKVFGDDFGTLREITDKIAEAVKPVQGLKDVTTTLETGVPEYVFHFDRDKLSAYSLSAGGLFGPMMPGSAIPDVNTAVGGQLAGLYREAGKEHDITIRLKQEHRKTFEDIGEVPITSQAGIIVPLRDVADFEFDEGPTQIERENSKRIAKVEANMTDRPIGEIVPDILELIKTVPLPEGYTVEFGGEYEDMMEAFTDLLIMFVAAILLVYMILASLYESIIHPITIMVAVPLAFTGAVAGLFITGVSFGVTAFIGMIMLVGIVATNSIVLMDFIIEYHRSGMDRREAIIEAGRTRLRPILMTALTTLFGVLPIALGRAEGMELQQPLGIVVVGGLITSTALTLIVIPVFYQLFDDFSEDMKNLFRRKKPVS